MRHVFCMALGLVAASGASAQSGAPQRIDRIAAVVGEVAIPESRLQERLLVLRRNEGFPTDSAEVVTLRYQILQSIVDEELLMQVADRDTAINISDEQVQQAAEARLRAFREQFSSVAEYERELRASGLTSADEHRRMITERVRAEMTVETLKSYLGQTGVLRNVAPTDAEMRAFFQAQLAAGAFGERPPTVSFRQIVIRPLPDSSARREAFTRADSAMRRARAGEDFAVVAAEMTEDPGSKGQGGSLGWQRRGTLDPIFEDVAFRLRPGQISPIVPTQFGFHVIQVQRIDAAEVLVRHILTIPRVTEENRAAAEARSDSVTQALRNGASFDSLVAIYHDPEEETLHSGVLKERLPEAYSVPLENAQPGDVFGPVPLPAPTGVKYATLMFQEEMAAGVFTFDELRDRLRTHLAEENGFARYMDEVKRATHVEIRIPAPGERVTAGN